MGHFALENMKSVLGTGIRMQFQSMHHKTLKFRESGKTAVTRAKIGLSNFDRLMLAVVPHLDFNGARDSATFEKNVCPFAPLCSYNAAVLGHGKACSLWLSLAISGV